jgi:hypothetical protein
MRCDEVVRELATPTGNWDQSALAEHLAGCPACADWARRAERLDRLWDATRPAEPSPEAWDTVWANIAQALPGPKVAVPGGLPVIHTTPSRNGSGPKGLVYAVPAPVVAPAPAPAQRRGRSWRLAGVALVGLAQAAAILIALGLAWRTQPHPGVPKKIEPSTAHNTPPALPVAVRSPSPVEVNAVIPENCLVVLRLKSEAVRVPPNRGDEAVPGVGGLFKGGRRSAWMEDVTPEEMNFSSDIGLVIVNFMESVATPQMAAR